VAGFSDVVAELKRRRVIRALVVWGVVAFAVLQVYEPLMHGLHLPDWTLSFVVLALGLGFPVTAALAWVFDLKAGGIERTRPVAEEAPAAPDSPSRRLRLALLLLGLGIAAAAPGLVFFFVRPGGFRVALLLLGLGAAVAALGLGYLLLGPGGVRRTTEKGSGLPVALIVPSIAVLPFVNVSSDKEQEYFSDGIAEEILNALAQVDGLRVIGRTSSFSMKGRNEDLRTIGQRLGAAHLLEGSVRKSGTRVRITAQLVEASGGSHLWSQEFDRVLTDVFAVQEEIARAVVAALKLTLFPEARQEQRTISPEAHDPYLLGLAFLARGSVDAYGRAVRALRKSVELDPGYAQAWAALARARYWAADQDPAGNPDVEWPKALAAAERAIALAPLLADGYVARGLLRENALQDWPGARADFERARSLNPRSPEILLEFATLLAALGKLPEAIAAAKEAAALDPLAASTAQLATAHGQLGNAMNVFDTAAAANRTVSGDATTRASHLTDADQIQAATDLALAQRALEASLSATSSSFKFTLLDYLK